MFSIKTILFISLFIFYISYGIYFTRKIFKYEYFNRKQKNLHYILTWLLPPIWGFVLKAILSNPIPGSAELFEERNKHDSDYSESGKGHLGGGIL